ncbi:Mitochondrial distribution and morphology protein 12 [Blastocladiella emersonii ATCC 22665]|nr:Mitochondrial distribution and morphology protein 12 [Blastocladiella emersonii ATCC 22665]
MDSSVLAQTRLPLTTLILNGQILCYRCASNTILGESLELVGFTCVCDYGYCLHVVRSYSENRASPPALPRLISRPSPPVKDEDCRRTFFHRHQSLPTRTMTHPKRLIQLLLLARRGLSTAWEQIMCDMTAEDMDVRHFIKFKKAPSAKPADTFFLSGAATKKTLAYRKMEQTMQTPRIMVLTFLLEYNRVQDQFIGINPAISQAQEYLLNL